MQQDETFRKIYNFYRLVKVQKYADKTRQQKT